MFYTHSTVSLITAKVLQKKCNNVLKKNTTKNLNYLINKLQNLCKNIKSPYKNTKSIDHTIIQNIKIKLYIIPLFNTTFFVQSYIF